MERKAGLGAIFLTVFLDLVGFGIVMPFLALEAREIYGVSEGVATLLGASYSFAQFLFVPLWGRLSDRIGRRPVLLVSVALTAFTMLGLGSALAWSNTIVWLFLARIFGGIATANIGTASAYIADITSKEDRVKGMGLIGMAFGLGFIVGPGLGGLLSEIQVGGREGPMACFFAAGLSLINLIWVWRGVPESLSAEKRATMTKRSRVPLNIAGMKTIFSQPFLGRAVIANFCIVLAFSGLEFTYAFFAKDRFELSMGQVGGLFVFMGFMGALIQGGFIRRAGSKYQDSHLALWGLSLQAIAFIFIALSPDFGFSTLVGASAILAIGNGLTQPSLSGFLSRRVQDNEQGTALGTHQSFSALARVFGPGLGGFLYQMLGSTAPFLAGAGINIIALGVAIGLRGSPMPKNEKP